MGCPFCGGEPRLTKRFNACGYMCTCGATRFIQVYGKTPEEAAKAWNTRHNPNKESVTREQANDVLRKQSDEVGFAIVDFTDAPTQNPAMQAITCKQCGAPEPVHYANCTKTSD